MLKPGLYEQLINNGLKRELDEITEECKSIAQIDKAEAAEIISKYVSEVLHRQLNIIADTYKMRPLQHIEVCETDNCRKNDGQDREQCEYDHVRCNHYIRDLILFHLSPDPFATCDICPAYRF